MDISRHGLGLLLSEPVEAGRQLFIVIGLTHTSIPVVASVAWVKTLQNSTGFNCAVGVSFDLIDAQDRTTLIEHADTQAARDELWWDTHKDVIGLCAMGERPITAAG